MSDVNEHQPICADPACTGCGIRRTPREVLIEASRLNSGPTIHGSTLAEVVAERDILRAQLAEAQRELDEARTALDAALESQRDAMSERDRLFLLINTPRTDDFFEAVRIEAAHQVERWGVEHDDLDGVGIDTIASQIRAGAWKGEQVMHGLSPEEEIDYWRMRARRAEAEAKLGNEIAAKVNDAINRAGIHCALYYWEAIDRITAERDTLRGQRDRTALIVRNFREDVEQALCYLETRGKGGQRVSPMHEFASVPPSGLSRMHRIVRELTMATSGAEVSLAVPRKDPSHESE